MPAGGVAEDLGASPGGWTRIVRRGGLTVSAVDPGELDPRVATDPGVHHVRRTAGRFLAETGVVFDLVLNDMQMVAGLSRQVMLEAARRLKPGARHHDPEAFAARSPQDVNKACAILARSSDVLFARQLYHSRNEITVVARRRSRAIAVPCGGPTP
ncbi:MAG: SAM-dependent methyltransferase [Thermomicrobiales bacterium]